MAKIYKNAQFSKWQRKNKITDRQLIKVIAEMENGLVVDSVLGGDLFKQRIAKPGMDKRGAYRTIIAAKQTIGWIFIFGYEKNELANIDDQTLTAFKAYATDIFSDFKNFVKSNIIIEVLQNE